MLASEQPAELFPHRKRCEWIDQGNGLSIRMCDDGEVTMYHDANTRETWLPGQQPPSQWRRYFRRSQLHGLGATTDAGVCPSHPHAAPRPSTTIRQLQQALQALSRRAGDKFVSTAADGLVGPRTVKAANRALYMYAKDGAPPEFTTGTLTRAQVVSFAPQLTSYVSRSPFPSTSYAPPAPPPAQAEPSLQPADAPGGAAMNPYSTQPGYAPGYYPPGYAPVPRGPGGLPTDHATVDVRAFIPAQYEHVQINPTTVMTVIGIGLIFVLVWDRKKKGT